MTSGRDVLHQLDRSIAQARQNLTYANSSAAENTREIAKIDSEQVSIFNKLAEMRIDLLRENLSGASLGAVDQKAESLIAQHEDANQALKEKCEHAETQIEELEAKRLELEKISEHAVIAHETAVDKTYARLETSTEYQTLASAVESADAIVSRAEQKMKVAQETRIEKGKPYENDPLFIYLWDRKFATSSYKSFPLFAALDGWVARLIKFRDAQLNYRRLLELPLRLEEHFTRMSEAARLATETLETFEQRALLEDGVDKLRQAAKHAQENIDDLDKDLENAEANFQALTKEYTNTSMGLAGPMHEARVLLANALSEKSIPDLNYLAAETVDPNDDYLVTELIRLKREHMEYEENARANRRSVERQSSVLSDFENLRRRFKKARYDSPYSDFSSKESIDSLMTAMLRGLLSIDEVWRRINRARRVRRRDWSDDFGGTDWRGGFGLPDNWSDSIGHDDWLGGSRGRTSRRSPYKQRRPRAPRRPRVRAPRSRSRGGFKTGGGF